MKRSVSFLLLTTIGVAAAYAAATLTSLVTFDYTNGAAPTAGLIADASGNLFGTTERGGTSGMVRFST